MKHDQIVALIIGVFILGGIALHNANAGSIQCYPNPNKTHTTCVEIGGQGRSWTTFVAPNGMSTTIPLNVPSDRNVAPKHNYDECTVALGCIPRRNRYE